MKNATIRWYGNKKVVEPMETEIKKRLSLASEFLVGKIKKNVSTPTRKEGPSEPGEFPHADTGRLRNDIFWDFKTRLSTLIGTSLVYGLYHEVTNERSYLRRTLEEEMPTVRRIMTGKVDLP